MPYTVPKLTDYSAATLERAANECLSACTAESREVRTDAGLKSFRDRWMARKNGILNQINDRWLKGAPQEAKREAGIQVNALKARITELVEGAHVSGAGALDNECLDISLPGTRRPLGAEHPVVRTSNEIVSVFAKLGYSVAEGPVVESDYYNFEALNFPPNHPARDTQDTLFIAGQQSKPPRERLLLRTHTSPVQIRTMEKTAPPVRLVIPGKVHRNDPPDASHSPMFHQIEGLAVDTNITFGDLKGTLDHAMKALFGSSVRTHFRPSFFPFTEPSVEVDMSWTQPGKPWLEIGGAGMVDPHVLSAVGYDPDEFTGFAFGLGVERFCMRRYGIHDIRLFTANDVQFLQQF